MWHLPSGSGSQIPKAVVSLVASGEVRGAPSRGGPSHPPARAPCRPPRPPRAGARRGRVTAPPVGVAPRRRDAAAAVAAAAPLSPPHAPPATATWLYVPPCALAAVEPAGVHGVDASPSAPAPWRPGCCTHVPGIVPRSPTVNQRFRRLSAVLSTPRTA